MLLQSWREPISWVQYIIGISEKTKRDQLCKFNAWCMSGTKVGAKKQSRLSVVFALNCWFVGPVARVGDSCPCPCPRSTLNKHGRSAAASLLSTCLGNWVWPALKQELLDPASKYKIIHVQILQIPTVHYSTRFLSNSCQNPYCDRTILHMLHMYICNHLHMYHVKIAQRTCGGALSLSGQCSSAPWHHGSVDFRWRYISDR